MKISPSNSDSSLLLFRWPDLWSKRSNVIASDSGVITSARDSNQDNEKAGQRLFDLVLRMTF